MAADAQALQEVEDIRPRLEGYGSWRNEGTYDDLLLVVHPGYFEARQWYRTGKEEFNVTEQDYRRYETRLEEQVSTYLEEEEPVVVLYDETLEGEMREFFTPLGDEVDWIPTEDRSAVLTDQGRKEFAAVYASLEDEATVRVAGETEDRCLRYAEILVETLDRELPRTIEMEEGPRFGLKD